MTEKEVKVKNLIDVLVDANFDVAPYSGRGMFGKECVAITDATVWDVAKELFNEIHDDAFYNLPEPKQDQLGLGIVLYWPSFEWPKEEVNA